MLTSIETHIRMMESNKFNYECWRYGYKLSNSDKKQILEYLKQNEKYDLIEKYIGKLDTDSPIENIYIPFWSLLLVKEKDRYLIYVANKHHNLDKQELLSRCINDEVPYVSENVRSKYESLLGKLWRKEAKKDEK